MPPLCFNTSLSLLGMDKQSFSKKFLSSFFHFDLIHFLSFGKLLMSSFSNCDFTKLKQFSIGFKSGEDPGSVTVWILLFFRYKVVTLEVWGVALSWNIQFDFRETIDGRRDFLRTLMYISEFILMFGFRRQISPGPWALIQAHIMMLGGCLVVFLVNFSWYLFCPFFLLTLLNPQPIDVSKLDSSVKIHSFHIWGVHFTYFSANFPYFAENLSLPNFFN